MASACLPLHYILSLQLISIPVSNADIERVFSLVRRIKTEYRCSLATQTLSSLISCHYNKTWTCCERYKFKYSLLVATKKCTHERNMQYQKQWQCILAIIITFMLSLSEVTLIYENRQKYVHFESLICKKKFGTWRLCNLIVKINLAITSLRACFIYMTSSNKTLKSKATEMFQLLMISIICTFTIITPHPTLTL